jgi:hypothetical protein
MLGLASIILIIPLHLILNIPSTDNVLKWFAYITLNCWFFIVAGLNQKSIVPLLVGLVGIFVCIFKCYHELSELITDATASTTLQFALATVFLGGSAVLLVVVAPGLQKNLNKAVSRLRTSPPVEQINTPPSASPIKRCTSI